MKRFLLVIFNIIAFTSMLYSNGFQINAQGTKAISMGGAFAGLSNDPSAIYFNPSGITQIPGTNFIVGTSLIFSNSSFEGPLPSSTKYKLEPTLSYPIHIYATHQVNEKLFFGLGFGNNYGTATKWKDDWVGKNLAVETKINMYFINLVSSFQIIPEISVGFGYVITFGDFLIGRNEYLTPISEEVYIELNGNGVGSGFTAGVLFKATKALSIGVSYRSKVSIDLEGDSKIKNIVTQFDETLPVGSISTQMNTPENITFGIAIKPLKKFTLTADYQFVGWNSFDKIKIVYKELVDDSGELLVSQTDRNYFNSFIARVGAEYKFNRKLDIRAGFLYDKNPVDDKFLDPSILDSDRFGYSFGFGYKLNDKFTLDAGYLLKKFNKRKIISSTRNYSGLGSNFRPMNGIYNSVSSFISITLSYNF